MLVYLTAHEIFKQSSETFNQIWTIEFIISAILISLSEM